MDITVQELKQKKESGENFILIDVREPHEHRDFNVGGKLIPLGTVPQKLSQIEAHKGEEIVVYCRSGQRSGQAKLFLQQNGYTNVRNLTGGMLAWIDAFGR